MTQTKSTQGLKGNRFSWGLCKSFVAGILGMPGMLLCVLLVGCGRNGESESRIYPSTSSGAESTELRNDVVESREDSVSQDVEIVEQSVETTPEIAEAARRVVKDTVLSITLDGCPQEEEEVACPQIWKDTVAQNAESRNHPSTLSASSGQASSGTEITELRTEEVEDTISQAIEAAPQLTDTAQQPIDTIQQSRPAAPYLALRTNLLYDAVLVPNIGLEVWLGAGFTLGVDWFYTWIPLDQPHFYWQTYGGYLTARYYFGKLAAEQPYGGHHVGLYGSMLTYDVEFGGRGYQASKFGFGGGVEYGYSLPVAKNLCLDFNLGVGYQGGEYKTYLPTDDGTGHYVWEGTYKRHWFGPTKAEISLKWLIGPSEKKGGDQ